MKHLILLVTTCFLFLHSSSLVNAESIRDRMMERLPEINMLKSQGLVFETSDGYLRYNGTNTSTRKMVGKENADRKQYYTALGTKHGSSADTMGKRRAKQIREKEGGGAGKNLLESIPANVSKTIQQNCEQRWPDEFRMQKDCKEEEAKAWIEIQ